MLFVSSLLILCGIEVVNSFFAPSTFKAHSFLRMSVDHVDLALSNGAKASIRAYGGNCYSYITADGIEVLGKRLDTPDPTADSKPYSGGAPHCFPQFGPGAILQHGFARGMKFVIGEKTTTPTMQKVALQLLPTPETKKIWDYDFEYHCDITLLEDCMEWDLTVKNNGNTPFTITTGMHTYFDISSIKNVQITGPFTGSILADRLAGGESQYTSDTITVTAPVDAIYKGVTGPVVIHDSGKGTKTTLEMKGYADTVLWHPFGDSKMDNDKFICVEPVATEAVVIPAGGESVKFYQKISCTKV